MTHALALAGIALFLAVAATAAILIVIERRNPPRSPDGHL